MPKRVALPKQAAGFIETMDCLPVSKLPEGPKWTYVALCSAEHKRIYVSSRIMLSTLFCKVRGRFINAVATT